MDEYFTIEKDAAGTVEAKRSKFIAALRHVQSEEEALAFINSEKKKYHDAKHHCSAYIIKDKEKGRDIERFNDDGEPSGTAGKPIMDILKGAGLKDVCCVVTRYFGGVLLGTGGLVRAYSDAAKESVSDCERIRMVPRQSVELVFDYSLTGKIDNVLESLSCSKNSADYTEKVRYVCGCDPDKVSELIIKVNEISSGKAGCETGRLVYSRSE